MNERDERKRAGQERRTAGARRAEREKRETGGERAGQKERETGGERAEREEQETGGEQEERETDRKRAMQEEQNAGGEQEDASFIEGRNAVIEAFRSGRTIDKLYVLDGCKDGPVQTIVREARKHDVVLRFVAKERLDQLSRTGRHQGVIAQSAAYGYATVEEILNRAREKGEPPFLILLDGIEDPYNLGAIIRTANQAGAHGVIIPKRRASGLTATVARTSAGALNYTPVAKVTNLTAVIEQLKMEGIWFVCADMKGDLMYDLDLTGPVGLVIGGEGEGVGKRVRQSCDMCAAIPMRGDIGSLNASVAAGILSYEILRQRMYRRKGIS